VTRNSSLVAHYGVSHIENVLQMNDERR
jgi:hypothetical protein